jgi:hypothetical protein
VLLRLACLTVTNAFTFLRLLPMPDREKDIESWRCGISCSSYGARCWRDNPLPRQMRMCEVSYPGAA